MRDFPPFFFAALLLAAEVRKLLTVVRSEHLHLRGF